MSEENLQEQVEGIRFSCLRNVIYHGARRRALTGYQRFSNFMLIMLGTASVASATELIAIPDYNVTALAGVAVAGLSSLQLVFDFASRAKEHDFLFRDYFRLLGEVDGTIDADKVLVAKWKGKLAEIASSEPPVLRALSAIAYNEAAQAIWGDRRQILAITWAQSFFRHVWAFHGAVFQYRDPRNGKTADGGKVAVVS